MSRKNRWRTRGNLQFRRETRRYSDGSLMTGCDVLYIRIRRKACVFATLEPETGPGTGFWANDGLYFKPKNPVQAANQLRRALYRGAAQ